MIDRYNYDCKLFNGYKPCPWDSECNRCKHYAPRGPRVLVVRVHQLGNIVKSTPVLHALHKRYDDPWVTWLCSPAAAPLLRGNTLVDEVIQYSWEAVPLLMARSFDLILSLEANHAEVALAQLSQADRRLGFSITDSGALCAVNEQSLEYASLSVSDRLRFVENRKTLAELCFDLVGVSYEGEEYILSPSEEDRAYARELLASLGVDPDQEETIALCTGGDKNRFPSKDWPIEHFAELARLLQDRTDARILLMGGPMECEINEALASELGDTVVDTGCDHEMMQFAALMSHCSVSVSADCFAFHVAVAGGVHVVGLFGPTPAQEMAIFGRGRKLVTDMDCGPCYIRRPEDCPHQVACMRNLTPEMVAEATLEVLEEARVARSAGG